MILDPTPATLFCGMGAHAKSVFLYLNRYAVKKIYIIYSKYNTSFYEAKITSIKQEINKRQEALDHSVNVNYIQINERDFLNSYYTLARLYNLEKYNYIITDLTAGHKIISYIMSHAYTYMRTYFKKESILIYFFEGSDNPIEVPSINIEQLNVNIINFLRDIDYYNNNELTEKIVNEEGMDEQIKRLSFTKYLTNGHTISGATYKSSTAFRYKKALISRGYIDKNYHLTMKGKMKIFVIKLSQNKIEKT